MCFLGGSLAFIGAGFAFGGLVGAGFTLLPFLIMLPNLGPQRLRCEGERIEYQRTAFWRRNTVHAYFADIQSFEHGQVERSRAGIGVHQVTATLNSQQRVTLLSNALSPLIAAEICKRLRASEVQVE